MGQNNSSLSNSLEKANSFEENNTEIEKLEEEIGTLNTPGKIINGLKTSIEWSWNFYLALFTTGFLCTTPTLLSIEFLGISGIIYSVFSISKRVLKGIDKIIDKLFKNIHHDLKIKLKIELRKIFSEINKKKNIESQFFRTYLYDSLNKLYASENIEEKLILQYEQNKNKIKINKKNKINVLLLGRTGVGKSTLINAFGGNADVNDNNKPTTMGFIDHQISKDNIIFTDSRGFDMKMTADEYIKMIDDEVMKRNNEEENINFIDIIYYCIRAQDNRFEDEEKELIEKLLKKYPQNICPIIFVITKMNYTQEVENIKKNIIKDFNENSTINTNSFSFIGVRAKVEDYEKEDGKKQTGLKELLDLTHSKANSCKEGAYFNKIKNIIIDLIYPNNYNFKQYDDNKKIFSNTLQILFNRFRFRNKNNSFSNIINEKISNLSNFYDEIVENNLARILEIVTEVEAENKLNKNEYKENLTNEEIKKKQKLMKKNNVDKRQVRESFIMKFNDILVCMVIETFFKICENQFNEFTNEILNNN